MTDNMKHFKFQYKEGENKLNGEINTKTCDNGLHFTNKQNLYLWQNCGVNIRKVSIPDNAYVMCACDNIECKSDILIIEDEINTEKELISLGILNKHILLYLKLKTCPISDLYNYIKNGDIYYGNIPKTRKTKDFFKYYVDNKLFDDIKICFTYEELQLISTFIDYESLSNAEIYEYYKKFITYFSLIPEKVKTEDFYLYGLENNFINIDHINNAKLTNKMFISAIKYYNEKTNTIDDDYQFGRYSMTISHILSLIPNNLKSVDLYVDIFKNISKENMVYLDDTTLLKIPVEIITNKKFIDELKKLYIKSNNNISIFPKNIDILNYNELSDNTDFEFTKLCYCVALKLNKNKTVLLLPYDIRLLFENENII
jgi:hypothetical protein